MVKNVPQRKTTDAAILSIAKIAASVAHFHLLLEGENNQRNPSTHIQRTNWTNFVLQNSSRPIFRRHLRMPFNSFNVLLLLIRNDLEVDNEMANLRGGPIIPEWCLYVAIRYLAGGNYSDILLMVGISTATNSGTQN